MIERWERIIGFDGYEVSDRSTSLTGAQRIISGGRVNELDGMKHNENSSDCRTQDEW